MKNVSQTQVDLKQVYLKDYVFTSQDLIRGIANALYNRINGFGITALKKMSFEGCSVTFLFEFNVDDSLIQNLSVLGLKFTKQEKDSIVFDLKLLNLETFKSLSTKDDFLFFRRHFDVEVAGLIVSDSFSNHDSDHNHNQEPFYFRGEVVGPVVHNLEELKHSSVRSRRMYLTKLVKKITGGASLLWLPAGNQLSPKSGLTRDELHDLLIFFGYVVDYPRKMNGEVAAYNYVLIGNDSMPKLKNFSLDDTSTDESGGVKFFADRTFVEGLSHVRSSQALKALENLDPQTRQVFTTLSGLAEDMRYFTSIINWASMMNFTSEQVVEEIMKVIDLLGVQFILDGKVIHFSEEGVSLSAGRTVEREKFETLLRERITSLFVRRFTKPENSIKKSPE